MTYVRTHLDEASAIIARLDVESVERLASELVLLREPDTSGKPTYRSAGQYSCTAESRG
jgi:hypothetical protein